MSQHTFRPNDLHGKSIHPINGDGVPLRSGAYGYGEISGLGVRAEPSLAGLTAGTSSRGYSTLEDPILRGQVRAEPSFAGLPAGMSNRSYATPEDPILRGQARADPSLAGLPAGMSNMSYVTPEDPILRGQPRAEPSLAGLPAGMINRSYATIEEPTLRGQTRGGSIPMPLVSADVAYERPDSQQRVNGLSLPPKESNIIFVDGLPTDCTRREVGHIFRPFIGFKDIKVIHKEPRRSGDKATVLCFVEFNDPKCALTAMDALQGYKFDDRKPDSSILRVQFAHFPLRLPSEHNDQRIGIR